MKYTVAYFKEHELTKIGDHDPFKIFMEMEEKVILATTELNITIYTLMKAYTINIVEQLTVRKNYMKCSVQNRAPYPGETQLRGSELVDGEFDSETWNRVLCSIVNNELQSIFKTNSTKEVENI